MMKLFRKDRVKSSKDSNNSSNSSTPTHSPKLTRREDKDNKNNNKLESASQAFIKQHHSTPPLQISLSSSTGSMSMMERSGSNSVYSVSAPGSSLNNDKKHNIRIGDTRFFGRVLFRARALYDYPIDGDTLHIEDEEIKLLRFRKGDIINVYEQDASGWWAGEHNNDKGIFPGSYMKVLEEEPEDHKHKSKDLSKDELIKKVAELEKGRELMFGEREKLKFEFEREKIDFDRRVNENRHKSDNELLTLRKILKDKQEIIDSQDLKIRELEFELEESVTKLSTKEVEVMTMEMELRDLKKKFPELHYLKAEQDAKIKRLQEEKEVKANLLKDIDQELLSKRNELQDVVKLRQEIEKGLNEAQTKLVDLEKPLGEGPKERRIRELEKQIDLLKKQLGEEVYERRRVEGELREARSSISSTEMVETLKREKTRLEAELKNKADGDAKIAKINLIIQGILQKDDSKFTVTSLKDILSKMKKALDQQTTHHPPEISPTPKERELLTRELPTRELPAKSSPPLAEKSTVLTPGRSRTATSHR